jgi:hypothetical protein
MNFNYQSPLLLQTGITSASFESNPPYEWGWASSGTIELFLDNWGNTDNTLTVDVYWGTQTKGLIPVNSNIIWKQDTNLTGSFNGLGGTTTDVGGVIEISTMKSRYMKLVFTLAGTSKSVDVQAYFFGRSGATANPSTQPILQTDGTNTVNTLKSDGTAAGQNAEMIAGTYLSTAFTTTSVQAIGTTDAGNYRWVSVQFTSQGTSASNTFQGSNDNTNWVSIPLQLSTNIQTSMSSLATGVAIYSGPLPTRYFRINATAISAGTTAGVMVFSTLPAVPPSFGVAALLTAKSGQADGSTTVDASALGMVYSGTNFNRLREATTAAGTTGTGLLGAAALGFDGTNYQRFKSDTSGNIFIKLVAKSVSTQTALTTTATVSGAAGTYVGGSYINLNSVPSYIQVFDTTGAVTLGTTVPTFVQPVPANATPANGAAFVFDVPGGIGITNGIKIAATTTATGASTSATALIGYTIYT